MAYKNKYNFPYRNTRAPSIQDVDYKDIKLLKKHTISTGKIIPGRLTGLSAKCQRQIAKAVKRARFLALLPYTDRHKHKN